ncbi:Predicted ABC-type ATPase [Stigmatella aurantiaca]|uniref:Predicted ABC-type ATPase n=1 Tax=Stigmatella aurantiaca TaxID=41 RepID=A0A1H7PBQ1_STIAU|nr:zeta toxin family protein [Stigmatella aurantiaca]SEL33230.1 Predicted ABC-type ATPase [Stigmatella aurantiaca]
MSAQPQLVVLAGPNGAGKSTFFERRLRATGLRFVNADILARAIAPEDPASASYAAAKAADAERRELVKMGMSFCMETVFSDPAGDKLAFLREAMADGYRVVLLFIGLESPELSQARVISRVASGGHDVPDEKLFSRFPRTLENLAQAARFADETRLYDNSDARHPYRLLGRLERGRSLERFPPVPTWAAAVLDAPEPK